MFYLGLRNKVHTVLFITVCCSPNIIQAFEPVYPSSQLIKKVKFILSSKVTEAPGSDNWPLTWGKDDHQYTSWGDGGGFSGTNEDGRVSLGFGRIENDVDKYRGVNIWGGKNSLNPATFEGKNIGIIDIDSTLYAWRNGASSNVGAFDKTELYVSHNQAANFIYTGISFTPTTFANAPKIYSPTFLQFGKGYSNTKDDYVYIYAPENITGTWDVQKPGRIFLMRSKKNNLEKQHLYEYFNGTDSNGLPRWTTDTTKLKPVFEDPANGVMRTSVTYNAGLQRYILTTQQVSRYKKYYGHIGVYEAPEPWGPWSTVLFANAWKTGLQTGKKSVFWNFSNKWASFDGKKFVMVYTDNDEFALIKGEFILHEK